jgi:excinuclease ABC subunit A
VSTLFKAQQSRTIELRGVRTHNLKGFDLDLPLRSLISVTGVSGAGKSSLAFDTLFAEGQRRYVETFSPYTRQFLSKLDKPDADKIGSIPPAIALGQRHGRYSGRSTVASIADIHDALALLYARAGHVMCRNCGHLVEPASPTTVSRAIETWPEGTWYEIAFPLDLRPETDTAALVRSLMAEGFTRLRVNGEPDTLDRPALELADDTAVEVIVAGLTRSRPRLPRAWAGSGSSLGSNRGPTFAGGGARTAAPITSSHSPTCSAPTARLDSARSARGSGRRWSWT